MFLTSVDKLDSSYDDALLVTLASDGSYLSQKSYGLPGTSNTYGRLLLVLTDGSYLAVI